jgi:hypothetical protein
MTMTKPGSFPDTLAAAQPGDWLVRTTPPEGGARHAVQVARADAAVLWVTDLVTPYAVAYNRQGQRLAHPREGEPADALSAGADDLADLVAAAQTARRGPAVRQEAVRGAGVDAAHRLRRRLQEIPAHTWEKLDPDQLRQVAAWLGLKED